MSSNIPPGVLEETSENYLRMAHLMNRLQEKEVQELLADEHAPELVRALGTMIRSSVGLLQRISGAMPGNGVTRH